MMPFMAASTKSAYTFTIQSQESIVTYCTHVHQLFLQISNLSHIILLIGSVIVVPRELPFSFCSVAWTRVRAGAAFISASC